MSHLTKIYAAWDGNAEAMATDIGETGVTVRQWRNRDSIHSDHWPKIIKAAWEKRGQCLRFEDFVSPEVVAGLPLHIAGANQNDRVGSATNDAAIIGTETAPPLTTDNQPKNIRREGEADSHGPFSVSPSTCSATPTGSTGSCTNPACSTGAGDAA